MRPQREGDFDDPAAAAGIGVGDVGERGGGGGGGGTSETVEVADVEVGGVVEMGGVEEVGKDFCGEEGRLGGEESGFGEVERDRRLMGRARKRGI